VNQVKAKISKQFKHILVFTTNNFQECQLLPI